MVKSKEERELENKYWDIPYYKLQKIIANRGIKVYRAKKEEIVKLLLEDDIKNSEGVDRKMVEDDQDFVEDLPINDNITKVEFTDKSGVDTTDNKPTVSDYKRPSFEEKVENFMNTQQDINSKLLALLSSNNVMAETNKESNIKINSIEPRVYQVDDATAVMSEVVTHKEKIDKDSMRNIDGRGKDEARKINSSRNTSVEIKNVYVASELNHTYGWKTTKIQNGIHFMSRK